jgi:hypothetical protein
MQDLDPQKMVELTEARDQLRREVDKAKEDAGERAKALQQAQQVSPAAAFRFRISVSVTHIDNYYAFSNWRRPQRSSPR